MYQRHIILLVAYLFFIPCCLLPIDGFSQGKQIADIDKQIHQYIDSDTPGKLLYQEATKIFETANAIHYKKGMAFALYLQGKAKFATGEVEQAKKYYNMLLSFANEINEKQLEINGLIGLANIAAFNSSQEQSFTIFNQALGIAKAIKDSMLIANVYSSMAGIMINKKNIAEANQYLTIANSIYQQQKNIYRIATTYTVLSSAYVKQGNYVDGKLNAIKALQLFESIKSYKKMTDAYLNLGICYDYTNKKDSALYCYRKALELATLNPYKLMETDVCNNMAILFDDWQLIDSANKYYTRAFNLAKASKNYEMIALVAGNLAELNAERLKNYQLAYEYERVSAEATDSLTIEEKTKAFNELLVKFETKELADKSEILKKANELQKIKLQQKSVIIIGLILLMTLLSITGVMWMYYNKIKIKQEIIELEQKQLRSQMKPHFLFNALNSIQHFILKNDTLKANNYLSEYATLIRKALNISSETSISLHDEIAYLENYLTLELLRFEDKFSYQILLREGVDKFNSHIPPMIIQPFIENAIHHGLRHQSSKAGKLLITFEATGTNLICTVDDNGIGINASQKNKETLMKVYASKGIDITQKRLALISKIKGSDFSVVIEDKQQLNKAETGTLVTIKFPVA